MRSKTPPWSCAAPWPGLVAMDSALPPRPAWSTPRRSSRARPDRQHGGDERGGAAHLAEPDHAPDGQRRARPTIGWSRRCSNFSNALLIQPHLDVAEWLRGQALCTGALAWTFNGLKLEVDYGIPAGNKLTHRTANDAYSGSRLQVLGGRARPGQAAAQGQPDHPHRPPRPGRGHHRQQRQRHPVVSEDASADHHPAHDRAERHQHAVERTPATR